jgi:hypothetical protein
MRVFKKRKAGALRKSGGIYWGHSSNSIRRRRLILRIEETEAPHATGFFDSEINRTGTCRKVLDLDQTASLPHFCMWCECVGQHWSHFEYRRLTQCMAQIPRCCRVPRRHHCQMDKGSTPSIKPDLFSAQQPPDTSSLSASETKSSPLRTDEPASTSRKHMHNRETYRAQSDTWMMISLIDRAKGQ